jgi:HK97 family phage major capsid protein
MERFGLSVQELTELGVVIGKSVREQLEKNSLKANEAEVKKMINLELRDILKASAGHDVPFFMATNPMSPVDVYTIKKALEEPAGNNEIYKKLQDYNDDMYTLISVLKVAPSQLNSYGMFERRWSELAKALNTATAGAGQEWVPTGYSNQMIEFIELQAVVASLFQSFQMPNTTYIYPVLLGDGTAYLGGEATTDSPAMYRASTPRTSDLTFTAIKLIANYPVTEEMTEDSMIPVLPVLRTSIGRALAKAEDNAIINGDTTATHLDTGYTVGTDDARRAWKGLRRICSDANAALGLKNDGSTWTTSAGLGLIRALVAEMGNYGVNRSDLRLLCNVNMYNKIVSLDQVSTNDKFGNMATVHNGEIDGIDGIKIVKTQHVEENQNVTGIYDGTTLTDTQFLIVYVPGFKRGIRKAVTLEDVKKPLYGMEYLVATTRRCWKAIYDTGTQGMVGWVYHITK